jgi:hypothetical protein
MTDQNFGKRLSALQKQTCDVRNDMTPRVHEYYGTKMNQQRDNDQFWIVDEDDDDDIPPKPSRLIYSQALYQWMTNQITSQTLQKDDSILSTVSSSQQQQQKQKQAYVSFETLERIMNQLEQHPRRRQWTIEIGNNINLIRQGNALKIGRSVEDEKQKENYQDGNLNMVPWKWSLTTATKEELGDDNSNTVQIRLPYHILGSDINFFSTTLGDATNDLSERDEVDSSQSPSFLNQFVPPWKNSPVKIRQFLRGQNVPLHERDDIPLLILRTEGRSVARTINNEMTPYQLIAVQVEPSKWIVSKNFIGARDNDEDDDRRASILLSPAH